MNITVVRATPDHLSDVADLFDKYRRFYGQESDPDGARTFIAARLEQGDSAVFLAFNETTAVGFMQLYPSFSSVAMRRIWILNDLFVEESARRMGVAASLMEEARQFANEADAARLVLATATDNKPAQTLYEKLGWMREAEFIHYQYEL